MEKLSFNVESYEGPLDLLLGLIKKNDMDICNMQISIIFDQYLEQIAQWEKLDMEIAGAFITMASELLLIKSRSLLPRFPENEEDGSLYRLQSALMEYAKAKTAATFLRTQMQNNSGVAYREQVEPEIGEPLSIDIRALEKVYKKLLARNAEIDERPIIASEKLENLLKNKVTPIPVKVISVIRYLFRHGETSFETILLTSEKRSDLIATFAAVLELVKFQRVFLSGDFENPTLVLNYLHNIKNEIKTEEK